MMGVRNNSAILVQRSGWWGIWGLIVSLGISGCVTIGEEAERDFFPRPVAGVYHKVSKRETVWRIAQAYQVDMGDIILANHIPDAANIEEGQLLFIPGAEQLREVITAEPDSDKDEFAWPLEGRVIHYFGERKSGYLYKGIGIDAEEGQTVRAVRAGKVVFADYLPGYAHTVILDHQDGFVSVYGMNSRLLVNPGAMIPKGEPVALVGRRGDQDFLYFEIRKATIAENPLFYLPKL